MKISMGAFTIEESHSVQYSMESLSLMLRYFFKTEKETEQ